jgi:hypothetical protein
VLSGRGNYGRIEKEREEQNNGKYEGWKIEEDGKMRK